MHILDALLHGVKMAYLWQYGGAHDQLDSPI